MDFTAILWSEPAVVVDEVFFFVCVWDFWTRLCIGMQQQTGTW